jgi:two-component system chemotaxis response regulator CheY
MPSADELRTVIVADNDAQLRGILRSMFTGLGFHVIQASDGLEALGFAQNTQARLVILDKKMPNLDGLQACAQIRRLPGYAQTPIIILTVYDDAETRAAANDAGATSFFAKPFRPDELLQNLAPLLGIDPGDRSQRVVWKPIMEPSPAYGEPPELSLGRKLLALHRRQP